MSEHGINSGGVEAYLSFAQFFEKYSDQMLPNLVLIPQIGCVVPQEPLQHVRTSFSADAKLHLEMGQQVKSNSVLVDGRLRNAAPWCGVDQVKKLAVSGDNFFAEPYLMSIVEIIGTVGRLHIREKGLKCV